MTTTHPIGAVDSDRVIPEWELCDRLRRSLRLVPNLDNADIAEIMGVQRTTVSTWLGGRRTPNRAVLTVWADMTGVDQTWLETGRGDELRARRDSNPKPSDLVSRGPWRRRYLAIAPSVNRGFTPDRLVAVS